MLVGPVVWTAIFAPIVYVVYTLVIFLIDVRRKAKHVLLFPGENPHPILGHVHRFPGPGESGLAFLRQQVSLFPRVFKAFYGIFIPTIAVVHPETAKEILVTAEPKPTDVGGYRLIHKWLGDGLLIAGGAKWARNRRLLTPAFHFDILKPYIAINNSCVEVFLDKLEHHAGKEVEMFSHVSLCTLDIILRCAFSYSNDCQTKGENHPYVSAITQLQEAATDRLFKPWLYPDFIYGLTATGKKFNANCTYVHTVAEEIIAKRREALQDNQGIIPNSQHVVFQNGPETESKSNVYLDFLDILLTAKDSDGNGLSDLEIRNEVDTFLFEGHDTTASGISWTLYSLATHPEHQKKCQEEIDAILQDRESHAIQWDDLPRLKYLTLCIKEALRLHTPVPFIERRTTKDMTVNGQLLARGTTIDIMLYGLHTNAEIWPEPLEYKPERFLLENQQKQDHFAFLPFSAGPRNCIGQHFAMHEMKVVIARILHRFTLSVDNGRNIKHRLVVVMKTEDGMPIRVTPRGLSML